MGKTSVILGRGFVSGGYPAEGYPPPGQGGGYGQPYPQQAYGQPPPQQVFVQAPPPPPQQNNDKGCVEGCLSTNSVKQS
ncbi:hypothetical protein AKJ16_DCAP16619 [Drosera capensis]